MVGGIRQRSKVRQDWRRGGRSRQSMAVLVRPA